MKAVLKFCALLGFVVLSTALAGAQTASDATQRFEKAGVAFDFPAGWKATDNSNDNVQYVTIAPKDGGVQISVISQLATSQQCEFEAAGKKITDSLVESVATQIQGVSRQASPAKTQVGAVEVHGLTLSGRMNNAPVTGEIYFLRRGLQFISLVYLRVDGDSRGQAAWNSIRNTLTLPPPVYSAAAVSPGDPRSPGVLNGRALRLGRPQYPSDARQAYASGTVVVQVTIDEAGRVVAAQAMAGHPLLRGSAEAAAIDSEFSPTKLCGEPVRVRGVITYNFVRR